MRRASWRMDIEELERVRAGCPKAVEMQKRFRDALDRFPCHRRIEHALLGLGFDVEAGRELKPEEVEHLEKVLKLVEEEVA